MNNFFGRVFFSIFILIDLMLLSSCGGGSSSENSQLKSISEILAKGGIGDDCYTTSINDHSDVLSSCSSADASGTFTTYPVVVRRDESIEVKDTLRKENSVSTSYFDLSDSGSFIASPAFLIDNGPARILKIKSSEDLLPLPNPYTTNIWTGKEYKEIADVYGFALSDNGDYLVGNNSDGGALLYKNFTLKNLGNLPVGYVYSRHLKPTNNGVIFSEIYKSEYDGSPNKIFYNSESDSGIVDICIGANESVGLLSVNNHRTLLLVGYKGDSVTYDYYLRKWNGELVKVQIPEESEFAYPVNVNDNEVVLISGPANMYVFTEKSGLRKISEIVSLPPFDSVFSQTEINNKNEVVLSLYENEEGVKEYIVSLGDL